jgi:hypothetical protein
MAAPSSQTSKQKVCGILMDFDAESIEGPMREKNLVRLLFDEGFWFEWVAFHPDTQFYEQQ